MDAQPQTQEGSLTPAAVREENSWRQPTLARTAPSRVAAVLAMDQMGVPREEIARREHMSKATVYQIVKQGDHIDQNVVERVKKHLAAHYWISAERSLQHITDDKLEKASANTLMWTAGVATDKALLLEGKPTSRVEYMSAEDAAQAERIRALESELEGWKEGTTMNVVGVVEGTEGASPTE